jgi:autotransporter-associated beta strand protein
MKSTKTTPTTRESLITTAAYNTRWFAGIVAGTAVLGSSALAVNNDWTGAADNNWNNAANWALGRVPANPNGAPTGDNFDDARIPVLTNFPVVNASPSVAPRDIKVGEGGGATGRVDHNAGTVSTGTGNWFFVGTGGGNGIYNLANTSGTGGIFTGKGLSDGSVNAGGTSGTGGRLYVGGGAGGVGVFNVNTTGTLTVRNDMVIGEAGGSGTFNMDAGTVTTGGWNFCGAGAGSQGFMNISGGTLTNSGRFYFGENGTATVVQTGGSVINNDEVRIGQGATGVATYTLSGGTFSANNWCIIGREGADGTLNLSGSGTFIKNGGDPFALGNDPGGGSGTLNQDGGTLTTANGSVMRIGGHADSPGVWTMTAGTATIGGQIQIGADGNGTLKMDGGTINAPGNIAVGNVSAATFTLNGGTLTTGKISGGGGLDVTTFNGTQIVVNTPINPFIENLDSATIGAGGLKIDTNGVDATVTQTFSGTGGVIKTGLGRLSLTGPSTNSGNNTVSAGKLVTNTAATNSGSYTVADGATLGVAQVATDQVLTVPGATFGSAGASGLDIDLGNFTGNTASAPLNVTGTLTLNGNVTINIADQLPELGIIPLVSYTGPKAGTGSFVLGTLPNGVVATLSDNGTGLVSLNVTSVALPYWDGTVDNIWNTSTQNWINLIGSAQVAFANGNPALFDDFATGPGGTNVALPGTVIPSSVTFNNSTLPYTLSGAGKISGTGGLLKQGTAAVSISTANDYTGVTRLEGGVTTVDTIANGGAASPIGASTAASSNLVLAGGTLAYDGAASATTDRGFTIDGASGIATQDDLTVSGQVVSLSGRLNKTGPANLTLSNAANTIGMGGQVNQVIGGTLTLNGAGATTTIPGELWIGNTPNVSGNVVVDGGSLNVGSWIALGRGNGDSGTVSNITLNNATVQCVNFSTGYDNGLPNNSDQNVTLSGASTWTNNGTTLLAESANALTNMTIGGTSSYIANGRFQIGLGLDSVANMTVKDSGSFTKTGGWLSIGNSSNGNGTLLVRDNGTFTADGDFNVADVDTSTGTITLQNSATVTSTGTFFVGKNLGTTGTANLNGGTLRVIRVRGGGGTGNFTFNGGTLQALPAADGNFMSLLTNVVVEGLGGTIDTNGNNVTIDQALLEGVLVPGGGITKTGAGTLTLNTSNTYTGTTTVAAGTLAGTGFVAGPLSVSAAGTIAPGNAIGTFSSAGATISGTYACQIDGVNNDVLDVAGALNLSAATDVLAITTPGAGATRPVYVIGNYTSRTGTFDTVTGLPSGYTVVYDYNNGITSNNIAIVRPVTAFETWVDTYFPGETNPAIIGAAADPDNDGQPNSLEFALGGVPNDGGNNAKVYQLQEDSSDAGTAKELLLTIAVRSGTPAFTGSPSPTATHDGATYTVQGSTTLAAFTSPVTVVAPVTTGLPAAPAGYEYRTFSLDGSDGLPSKGFLRVNVTP